MSERVIAATAALVTRATTFSARNAGLVAAAYVLFALGGLALAILKLEVDTDPSRMISPELEFQRAFVEFTRAFPALDTNFVAVVEAENPATAKEAARALAGSFRSRPELFSDVYAPGLDPFFERHGLLYLNLDELRKAAKELDSSTRLLSTFDAQPDLPGLAKLTGQIATAAQLGMSPGDPGPLLNRVAGTFQSAAEGQAKPFDWNRFLEGEPTGGARRWFVFVRPHLDFSRLEPAEAALGEARRLIGDMETNLSGATRIRLTGEVPLSAEELKSATDGAIVSGLASFALVTLIVFFGIRSGRVVVASLLMLVLGFLLAIGWATVAVGSLNLISIAFVVLYGGLGIDFAIHFGLRFEEEAASKPTVADALAATAHGIGPAQVLCAATATLSFLAFAPTDFVGMAQLGLIAGGGIVIACVGSFTLTPALLMLMSGWSRRSQAQAAALKAAKAAVGPWRLSTAVTVVLLIGAAVSAVFAGGVRFDGNPLNLKDPDTPAVRTFVEIARDKDSPPYSAQVLVPDRERARLLAAELEALPEVRDALTVLDFVPADQEEKLKILKALKDKLPAAREPAAPEPDAAQRRRALNEIDESLRRIVVAPVPAKLKEEARAARQAMSRFLAVKGKSDEEIRAVERALFASFPAALRKIRDLVSVSEITVDTLDEDIRKRYVAKDGRYRIEVLPEGDLMERSALQQFADAVRSVAPQATGSAVDIAGAAEVVARAMLQATGFAAALILVILVAMLRRPVDVILVLTPIAVAGLILAGTMALFDRPFNFANVIVLPLLIGLGVDSGIHYVMRFRETGHQEDISATSTPRAVLLSALTTICSFGTLILSSHRGQASMGELLTLSITLSVVCTLLVLPQLVRWTIGRNTQPSTPAAFTQKQKLP